MIGPWLLLLIYDAILYIVRVGVYELPIIGGKARNRPRPRAPSLSERPNGKERPPILTLSGGAPGDPSEGTDEGDKDGVRRRHEIEAGMDD